MKVALLIPSLNKFGPIVFTDFLVRSLKLQNVEVEIFYFDDNKHFMSSVEFDCKTTKINFFRTYDFSSFDILHSTMLKPDCYIAYHNLSKKFNCVTSMHNYIDIDLSMLHSPIRSFLMIKLWYLALKRFSNFIVSSKSMEMFYFQKLTNKAKISVINYGIDLSESLPDLIMERDILNELRCKYKIIGSCGLIIKRKGFEQLVELLRVNPRIAVVIIGTGPEEKSLIELAKKYDVYHRLLILGFKKNALDYYHYFDVFAMCSFSEGFGLAMLQALALKLPLVCSNLDIYKDVFDAESVALFNPGSISSLNLAVNNVLADIERYKCMSYGLFNKHFSLYEMGLGHSTLYHSLAD